MKIVKIEESKVAKRGKSYRDNKIVENLLRLEKGEVLEMDFEEYTAIIGNTWPSAFLGRLQQYGLITQGMFRSKKIGTTLCFTKVN